MKITKTLQAALLAIAGLAMIMPQAKATITTYTTGDILLGFRQTGATNDYIIDIGQQSALPLVGNTTFGLGSVATDLAAVFGSTWYTSNTVKFSAFGDLSTGNGKIFIGNSANAAQAPALAGFLGNADTAVASAESAYQNQTASTNASTGLVQLAASTNSYA